MKRGPPQIRYLSLNQNSLTNLPTFKLLKYGPSLTEAVLAGAAKHGHSELSMVVVHTKEMTMTNGPLLRQVGPSLKASLQMLPAFAGRLPPTPKSWLQTRTPARSGGEFQCEPCAPINMEDGRCNCTTYSGRLGWLRCEYMLTRDDLQSSRPYLYEGHNCECECKGCPL